MRRPTRRRPAAAALTAILAATFVAPATQAAPATVAAGSIRAVFVDVLADDGNHVLQTWTEPEATLDVTWDGDELIVDANTADPFLSQVIRMGPRLGEALPAGPYDAPAQAPNASTPFLVRTQGGAGGYTCEGDSFTIHGISPIPQPSVETAITALSASFIQECGNLTVRGESAGTLPSGSRRSGTRRIPGRFTSSSCPVPRRSPVPIRR